MSKLFKKTHYLLQIFKLPLMSRAINLKYEGTEELLLLYYIVSITSHRLKEHRHVRINFFLIYTTCKCLNKLKVE